MSRHSEALERLSAAYSRFCDNVLVDDSLISGTSNSNKKKEKRQKKETKKQALELSKRYISEGLKQVVSVPLDVATFSEGEAFRSRLAQSIYNGMKSKIAASSVSKVLNKISGSQKVKLDQNQRYSLELAKSQMRYLVESELLDRGHSYVVSDNQILVFLRSELAANRVCASLGQKLQAVLCVPEMLPTVEDYSSVDVYGYSFIEGSDGALCEVSNRALGFIKAKARKATARSRGVSFSQRMRELAQLVGEFDEELHVASNAEAAIDSLNKWLAARCRMLVWKQWKLVRSRISNLEQLGVAHDEALALGSCHMGYWAAANSVALERALPYSVLRKMGFSFFSYCS